MIESDKESPERNMHRLSARVFLVLIPFINVFNYYLTYSNIGFRWRTFLTFSIDTAEGYIAWYAIHRIIIYLDRTLPFEKGATRRLAVQLILTILSGVGSVIFLTWLVNWMATDQPLPMSFFTYDIPIISVWFLVANGVYISLHFYEASRQAASVRAEIGKIKLGGIKVKTGKQEFKLSYDDIAVFQVEGEYIAGYTVEDKVYVLDQSMDALEKNLPHSYFFRLNRKVLAHRQVIAGFEKAEYGKLKILFKPQSSKVFIGTVSRTKAAEFREWFNGVTSK